MTNAAVLRCLLVFQRGMIAVLSLGSPVVYIYPFDVSSFVIG
jgi:hypothetical protein